MALRRFRDQALRTWVGVKHSFLGWYGHHTRTRTYAHTRTHAHTYTCVCVYSATLSPLNVLNRARRAAQLLWDGFFAARFENQSHTIASTLELVSVAMVRAGRGGDAWPAVAVLLVSCETTPPHSHSRAGRFCSCASFS